MTIEILGFALASVVYLAMIVACLRSTLHPHVRERRIRKLVKNSCPHFKLWEREMVEEHP